ncbi:MAG: hypothetical protein ACLR2E_21705 [Lachnospiraceae bacterium]
MMFAMLFHGGLIPTYIVVTQVLHLGNTLWVLILTMLVSPWNIFLMKAFSQYSDGASGGQLYRRSDGVSDLL